MMSPKEIKKYLPENSGGLEGLKKLREIGYPHLGVVTNSLFNHLDKTNFPSNDIQCEVANILRESGDYLESKVSESHLAKRSPQRKFALLKEVLPYWSREQLISLSGVIYGFVEGYDFYGLDVYAIKIMCEKDLVGHTDIEHWLNFKKKVYEDRITVLKGIKNA